MSCRKDTIFYKRIRPCVAKYLTKYSENGKVQFESEAEFTYGSSGFRDKFEEGPCDLINAINKSGIFLGLLFIKYNYAIMNEYKLFNTEEKEKHKLFFNLYKIGAIPWKNVGIIITASHNPFDENGMKILDTEGKQIEEIYEKYLTELVNSHLHFLKSNRDCSINDIIDYIIERIAYYFKKEASIDMFDNIEYNRITHMDDIIYYYNLHNTIKTNICVGFDTRDSGMFLNNVLIESLNCLNIKKCINNMCYVTTPCMHFVINYLNCWKEDERINKVLQNKTEYTFHKRQDDLVHLDSFYLKEKDQIKQLYFTDIGRVFCLTNSAFQNKTDTLYNSDEIYRNLCDSMHIDVSSYRKETNNFHVYAYNSEQFYYDYFCFVFEDLILWFNKNFDNCLLNNYEEEEVIYVDCSNGIGGIKLDKFMPICKMLKKKVYKLNCLKENTDILNVRCGADYVYSKREIPVNFSLKGINGIKCCSFDGDADRIVYFHIKDEKENGNDLVNGTRLENSGNILKTESDKGVKNDDEKNGKFRKHMVVLDGTKIICLFFKLITNLLSQINLDKTHFSEENNKIKKLNISIIQTAYANGAYINYLQQIKDQLKNKIEVFKYIDINIKYAKTGIKHLERIARLSSIGIFFEPNGHGTIYTKIEELNEWAQNLYITDNIFFTTLKKYLLCFSQTAGDAIIDFFLIELTLKFLNLTLKSWDDFFEPFPAFHISLKCKKSDLKNFQTHPEHERYLLKPISLQKKIEEIVQQIDSKYGRCLVRPSGTEHLIRIYAEAETSQKMHQIIDQVKQVVQGYLNTI